MVKKAAAKKAAPKKAALKKLDHDDPNFLPTEYNLTESRIRELKKMYDPKLIPVAKEKGDEGYLEVHEKVMNITKVRTNIDKKRKVLKADALAWGKKVDGEARRLTEIVEKLEEPWRKIKTDLDEAEKRAAEAAAEAEAKRQEKIQGKIDAIKSLAEGLLGASSDDIWRRIEVIDSIDIDEETFEEFIEAADYQASAIRSVLETAYSERKQFEEQKAAQEKQAAEMAAKQAELDAQQKAIDDQKAEQDRREKESKEKAEREERERREAKDKAEREEREKAEREKREAELKARLPEDQKLRAWVDSLLEVDAPSINNGDMLRVADHITLALEDLKVYVYQNTQG